MGIEVEATCSPRVERKGATVGTRSASYEEASEQLSDLAEIDMGAKRIGRLTQRIGKERIDEREQRLKDYQALPLPQRRVAPPSAPAGSWKNRLAVVMVDGGRAQCRDERWGTPRNPGEAKRSWWREPKVAMLATFQSQQQATDPMPDVPECLLNPLWFIPRMNEIKAARGGEAVAEELSESLSPEVAMTEVAKTSVATPDNKHEHWSPEPLVRSFAATFEPYEHLGELAELEAYHRGYGGAQRKAFLGDGLPSNWKIHSTHFSEYTPILDLMHALSYAYQAAQESSSDMQECWDRCQSWVTHIWSGQVGQVIDSMDRLISETEDESVLETLTASRNYLSNNRGRMKYAAYRREGMPITTALMESSIKQCNRRMKGTEKFWRQGAEPQLQLCADQMSETDPLPAYWERRAAKQSGFRKSRTTN
jgi:hypothetical protein